MYFEIWLSAMNGYAVVLVVVCRCYLIIGAAAGRRFRGVTIAEHQERVPTQPPYTDVTQNWRVSDMAGATAQKAA